MTDPNLPDFLLFGKLWICYRAAVVEDILIYEIGWDDFSKENAIALSRIWHKNIGLSTLLNHFRNVNLVVFFEDTEIIFWQVFFSDSAGRCLFSCPPFGGLQRMINGVSERGQNSVYLAESEAICVQFLFPPTGTVQFFPFLKIRKKICCCCYFRLFRTVAESDQVGYGTVKNRPLPSRHYKAWMTITYVKKITQFS